MRLSKALLLTLLLSLVTSAAIAQPPAPPTPALTLIFDKGRLCRATRVMSNRLDYIYAGFKSAKVSDPTIKAFKDAIGSLQIHACSAGENGRAIKDDLQNLASKWEAAFTDVANNNSLGKDDAEIRLKAQLLYEMGRVGGMCGLNDPTGYIRGTDLSGAAVTGALYGASCFGKKIGDIRSSSNLASLSQSSMTSCLNEGTEKKSACDQASEDDPTRAPPPPSPKEDPKADEEQKDPPDPAKSKTDDIVDAGINAAKEAEKWGTIIQKVGGIITIVTGPEGPGPVIAAAGLGIWAVGASSKAVLEAIKDKKGKGDGLCLSRDVEGEPAYVDDRYGIPLTTLSKAQSCICKQVEAYGKKSGKDVGLGMLMDQGNCQDQSEKKKLDCMKNPFGPDDGISKTCTSAFEKDNDLSHFNVSHGLCHQMQCPALQEGVYYDEKNGTVACDCQTKSQLPPGAGSGGGLGGSCQQVISCADGGPSQVRERLLLVRSRNRSRDANQPGQSGGSRPEHLSSLEGMTIGSPPSVRGGLLGFRRGPTDQLALFYDHARARRTNCRSPC